MSSQDIVERCRKFEAPGMRTFAGARPFVVAKAVGSRVEDADGRSYVDLSGFHGVASIGHAHPKVVEAIARQAADLIHCPTSYPSQVRADFYEALGSLLPAELNAIIPALSGAMANEIALLIARTRKPHGEVVAFSGGYHGRSVGTVGVAGKTGYRQRLGLEADAQFVPFPYPLHMGDQAIERVMSMLDWLAAPGGGLESIAAVITEPIQGNGGVVIPPPGFLRALRQFCDKHDALLIVDEVQSGASRTGAIWSFQHDNIVPDIMTAGKAIGGGMPVAATVVRRELAKWAPDTIAGTFLVNHVNLAAATAAIEVLRDEDLAARSKELGSKYLGVAQQRLSGLDGIAEIRGKGLWIAAELKARGSEPASKRIGEIIREAQDQGVLLASGGYSTNVIKIAPALNIDEDDLARGVEVMISMIAKHAS